MTGRPDDGYRAAARIESRSGRRGRFLAILFGLVVVGWGAIVLGSGPVDRGAHATGSGPSGVRSGPLGSRSPTFPPNVVILDPRVPTAWLPVQLAGLHFLDPRGGALEPAAPVTWLQFPFATADGGAVCVCIDPGAETDAASILHAMSFLAPGALVQDLIVDPWLELGGADGVAIEAHQIPGGQAFVVASAIERGGTWSVRLDWLDAATGDRTSTVIDTIAGATWTADTVVMRLAIAPDGRRLRLWLGADPIGDPSASPGSPPRIWTVPILDREFGPAESRDEPTPSLPPYCPAEAWASPTTFVRLCQADRDDGSGAVRTTLRIDAGAGRFAQVEIGDGLPEDPTGWLIDGARGVVFGWYAMSHRIVRVDVASGTLTDRYPGRGSANLLDVTPEAPVWPARTGTAVWQPFAGALAPLVGSPDGSVVYAIGLMPNPDAIGVVPEASTGIWAFDASSLALIGHWAPAATYDTLALTADGATLVGFGNPTDDEVARFGSHGPLVVFHDAHDGTVLSVLRGLATGLGGFPQPLAPSLPGGFGT